MALGVLGERRTAVRTAVRAIQRSFDARWTSEPSFGCRTRSQAVRSSSTRRGLERSAASTSTSRRPGAARRAPGRRSAREPPSPERELRKLLQDATVRRGPHRSRSPRLPARVDQVAPRESHRGGAAPRRAAPPDAERHGLANLAARQEPRRRRPRRRPPPPNTGGEGSAGRRIRRDARRSRGRRPPAPPDRPARARS